jgi:hypothetical protein
MVIVNDAILEKVKGKRRFTYKYTILDIVCDCEPPSSIVCQIVDVGQGIQCNGSYLFIFT